MTKKKNEKQIFRIALAQINPTVGDLKGNCKKIENFISRAKKFKADIVTFPELSICGYPPEDLLLKDYFIKDNIKALNSLAKKVSGIIALIGFVNRDKKGDLYNAAALIQNKKLKGICHKIELPNYSVFDEKRYFQPGKSPSLFALNKIIFGVNICEDLWQPKGVAKFQSKKGAKIIINISASPYYAGKKDLKNKILIERAKETKAYICYNNLIGGQDELVFDGAGIMLNPKGEKIAEAKQFEEDLIIADITIDRMQNAKCKMQKYSKSKNIQNSKSKIQKCIKLKDIKQTKKPSLIYRKYKNLSDIEEICNALILGTRDYIKKNSFKKAVIGLSGGIDSALTAAIACEAIGKDNVIGISMPSKYSSKETQSDAKLLADRLNIKLITVPINTVFNAYLSILEKEFTGLNQDVTEENLQARIRGNILMAFSNKFGWLVLTTGNKSETSVGYCTLYGDMVGGFAVIKDVPKTIVYKLARFVNQKNNKVIPESIIERAPSAELKENQKDQDSLPPYSVLDTILKEYIEKGKSFKEIILSTKFNSKTLKDVIHKIDSNEYKRRQSPPGIKITPKAFGKDRRLPITNKYRDYNQKSY
jgi:NAD+ synthase (glutamine-hydrolysing)